MDAVDLRLAVKNRLTLLGPMPIKRRPVQASLVAPPSAAPSARLLDLALRSIDVARSVDLAWLGARGGDSYPTIWPGEHYQLLAALVAVLQPKTVIELGTATGLSALALKSTLPEDGRVVTFDVISWRDFPRVAGMSGVVLREDDFVDGQLEQRVDDISTPEGWARHAEVVQAADLIFVDAAHDGDQERRFLNLFETGLERGPIVVFDDIRLWKLLSVWVEIDRPKLDLTSFGHWSGTGLVDYA